MRQDQQTRGRSRQVDWICSFERLPYGPFCSYGDTYRSWRLCVHHEHFVPMEIFANNLRRQAELLGISNAEVARRVGLDERRYAHYVTGRRQPDLETLVRIADKLGTTPNDLLGVRKRSDEDDAFRELAERFLRAAALMCEGQLEQSVVQAEAVAKQNRQT